MTDLNRTQVIASDPNRTQLGMPPAAFDPNRTVMGTGPALDTTQATKPMQCTVCRTFNPGGVIYCTDCGLVFAKVLSGDAFAAPKVELPTLSAADGTSYVLRPGENTVGREGDVLLSDGRVSRRHAKITLDGDVLTVEDLGSSNGTKVDGEALSAGVPRAVTAGARLSFGGVELALTAPGARAAGATQAMPGAPSLGVTQTFAPNRTQAIAAPPTVAVKAAARLVGGDLNLPLRAGANTFGRKSDNDAVVSDPYVSGRHGLIEVTDDGVWLTDTGSSNGTVLTGVKIAPHERTRLGPDDVIRLGALELRVVRS